ncbi:MAG: DUF4386 domain-containing protein [Candidatus Ryanbacteria bacterium]|nr:DUF4386 domain-containing protein [Candidatus Ryanbacteria bacterium]
MFKNNTFLTDTRITGLLYLGLAVTGIFVFIFAKGAVYVSGDALATNSHLLEKEMLARVGVAVELLMVAFQALVALWFYKLFSRVNSFASVTILAFGMVNAIMILVSSALWLGALTAAIAGESVAIVYNLFNLHELIWLVAHLFFGLWLVPIGYLFGQVMKSKVLAKLLYIGGVGYLLSALVLILLPDQITLDGILTMPATIGEFWVIGYLLSRPHLGTKNS